ncbi:carbohydrate-binding module family 48 protein [Lepidopterella palustris CBS 459.81]|uniref:Carbohydrate-binding module family 48 protein n=1 Tax=Lepidopterella palustris CBS 459.81 TaxID=1314670 RepID=A0A8E2JJI8_9PEZI|nr:carbohydrate-binding module family 48 protein [Lepidopterella palustris CBS 459.81]
MGNNPSRATTPTSNPQSPASATASHGSATIHSHHSVRREPRRRESIQALSNVKATAAPPSASLESATAHSSTIRPHSRSRSQTTAATIVTAPQARAHDFPLREKPGPEDKMGNELSREKLQRHPTPPSARPVDVPTSAEGRFEPSPIDPTVSSQEQYYIPASQYSRPPRLPLPIEEEVHTPGSPIISPADLSAPLDPVDVDGVLPRRTSVLSSTTVDEDDLGDELHGTDGGAQPAVPTLIEWTQGGERVYVTGTFAGNWDRKYRLHKDGPSKHKDALSAIINLVPGTHHLKFIVDGEMRLSDSLPTAVDFTNILVNYIEVSPDDLPHPPAGVIGPPAKHVSEPVSAPELRAPPGVYPPQVLPPTPELQPVAAKVPPHSVPEAHAAKSVPVVPSSPKQYHQVIPRYLADLDAPEDSSRFTRANAAVSNLPTPPTLPMFLSKSILNGTTPMKDDSSVLIMPNHTVLNHLATSSIKSNVLATSTTTRYKRKFFTTIMYQPTSVNGE